MKRYQRLDTIGPHNGMDMKDRDGHGDGNNASILMDLSQLFKGKKRSETANREGPSASPEVANFLTSSSETILDKTIRKSRSFADFARGYFVSVSGDEKKKKK